MADIQANTPFMFYASPDGDSVIRVYVEDDDTWVTQAAMTDIFGVTKSTVSEHLKNIYDEGELIKNSTVRNIRTVQKEGGRDVARNIDYYNLDAIISLGYRVNSHKATQFRIWATGILKEYMLKGFAMDDDRLKQGKQLFGKDYFDELLERIRDIRASERRFYQKITDIYQQCSFDYDKDSPLTQKFFSHAQNKLEYAVVNMTAAEIVKSRSDHSLTNMGLTTWKNQKSGGKVLKSDVIVAKNYLTEDEISDLNRLVTMFLDHAENLAKKGRKMSMEDWHKKLDLFLEFNEYEILEDYGKIRKKTAYDHANLECQKFKPIQEANYLSDFDKAVEVIRTTGDLPKPERVRLEKNISSFDKKLKKALDFNPKD